MAMAAIHASLSFLLFSFFLPTISSPISSAIQHLLQAHGLPGGLFPDEVASYTLDETGRLEVRLDQPCMTKFDTRMLFDSVIRANLSYGGMSELQGLSQEELFLWLPVKDITVKDLSSGLILFDIGVAKKQLSLSLFEFPPVCQPPGAVLVDLGKKDTEDQRQHVI